MHIYNITLNTYFSFLAHSQMGTACLVPRQCLVFISVCSGMFKYYK